MVFLRTDVPIYHVYSVILSPNRSKMDYEILHSEKSQLIRSDLSRLRGESQVLSHGAIALCREGKADLQLGFQCWHLEKDYAIIIFPGDVVNLKNPSDDFEVEILRYDRAMLREASLQLEQTVYEGLRHDRCRGAERVVVDIVERMFSLLRIYFEQDDCRCTDQLVLYQLKAFFLGYYDYVKRHRKEQPMETGSRRINELFNKFMRLLDSDYALSHNVSYYADKLSISPKYLGNIVREVNGLTPKTMIDHYVTMQIKLKLRTSDISIRQLAWLFHFNDDSFLCRYFRQRTGMSPQEYRRTYREE